MDIGLLGPTEISSRDYRFRLPGLKSRTLLAVLAINAGRTMSAEQLIDELWLDSPPKNAKNSLHVHVLRLRKLIDGQLGGSVARDLVQTSTSGYCLDVRPEAVDVHSFSRLVSRAHEVERTNRGEAVRLFTEALELWRGSALQDVDESITCRLTALALEETRLGALEGLFEAKLALGLHRTIVAHLEQCTAQYPLRERFCEQLMRALYRCGRQTDAIDAYQRTRRRLVSDFGLEPGEGIRSRLQEILQQIAI
jgi:DNA-binding SARP family transcriptional activator